MKLIVIFFFILGCTQATSLNLKKHQFGKIPTKIIWIQVAGLSVEHLAMLKFSYPSRTQKTAFEQSLCHGNMWEYNLFELRPSANMGFLSQLTGKKNIKNNCSDFDKKPIWKYMTPKGYKAGIFEGEVPLKSSLLASKKCSEHEDYLDDVIMWSMSKPKKGSKTFHVNTSTAYELGKTYFDQSCSRGDCFTSFSRNVEASYKQFSRNSSNHLFVVRNFRFQKYLKQNKPLKAGEELTQINEVLNYFQKRAKKRDDMLVLLTSAEAQEVDFPKSGEQWEQYIKRGRFVKRINSKLISSVFAYGARAENFCGVFEQSEVLSRIFSGTKEQGLDLSIINPFE